MVVTGSIPVPAGGMEGWPNGKGAYKIILSALPKPFTAIYLIIQEGYVFVCSNHTPSINIASSFWNIHVKAVEQ